MLFYNLKTPTYYLLVLKDMKFSNKDKGKNDLLVFFIRLIVSRIFKF